MYYPSHMCDLWRLYFKNQPTDVLTSGYFFSLTLSLLHLKCQQRALDNYQRHLLGGKRTDQKNVLLEVPEGY